MNKFGKTRKDIRWKRGEFVVVERVRKQSDSEDGGMREKWNERETRLSRPSKTPEGREESLLE